MDKRNYRDNLAVAQEDLLKMCAQREELDREIARMRQYVQTLLIMLEPAAPRPGGATFYNTIGNNLTEVVRLILSGSNRPLNVPTIRDQVIKFGFEIKSSNPLASIHSVISRLIEQGEVHVVCRLHDDGELKIYTRSFWWGEYGKLPKGWVLEDQEKLDESNEKGKQRVNELRKQDRERAKRELEKRTKERLARTAKK